MPDKAEQLKKILEILKEDTVSAKTFVELISNVLTAVGKAIDNSKATSAAGRQFMLDNIAALKAELKVMVAGITDNAEKRMDLLVDKTTDLLSKIRDGVDGRPGPKGDKGDKGEPGRDAELDIDAIIEQVLAKLPKTESAKAQTFFPFIAPRPRVHYYDLSSQCNGVLKTFSVPLNFGIIGVFSTQAPIIYRPVIDWTEGNRTLTLTSEVSAPATGQTLWIQYLK